MKLKKSCLTVLGITLMAVPSFAQKAKVVSAYNYNKSYERDKDCGELVKGIQSIEPATKDVKTSGWAKTWYYGGNLYFNAALSEECVGQIDNALDKTLEYYLTALKYNIDDPAAREIDFEQQADMMKFIGYLSNPDTKYDDQTYSEDILRNKFPFLANAFINKGVEAFQEENFEKAKEYSNNSVLVNGIMGRFDSLGMYNAALASERLKQYDEALTIYSKLAAVQYGGADIYLYMASILERQGDTAKKLEVVRKGLEVYPNNTNLILEELNYLMSTGQEQEALSSLDKMIANDPNNSSAYYNRGFVYDQKLKEYDKAASDYAKALELQPDFFDAAFNIGAMYYNVGVEWNNKATSYDISETAKYKEATDKANEYFEKAKPALEKAHEMDPANKDCMASLVKIYAILGENDKYSAMKAKLQGN